MQYQLYSFFWTLKDYMADCLRLCCSCVLGDSIYVALHLCYRAKYEIMPLGVNDYIPGTILYNYHLGTDIHIMRLVIRSF